MVVSSNVPVTLHSLKGTVHECVAAESPSVNPVTGFTCEQVSLPVPVGVTTSAYVQEFPHAGFTNFVTELSPQTKEFGKSIPAKPSTRHAFNQVSPGCPCQRTDFLGPKRQKIKSWIINRKNLWYPPD